MLLSATLLGTCMSLVACDSSVGPHRGEYPAPRIGQLEPGLIPVGSPVTTLFVLGEGFVPESAVHLDDTELETEYVGRNELSVEVPASALESLASYELTVVNPSPGGGESPPALLNVESVPSRAYPRIESFEPWATTAGSSDFTLEIRGSGFTPSSTVQWNGEDRTTTYVHSGELTIVVSASDVASPGAGRIVVGDDGSGVNSFVGGFPILSSDAPTMSAMILPLRVADVESDPTRDVVYAAVPSSASDSANTVLAFDPYDGSILWSTHAGSDPRHLAVSHDGAYLYAALDGEPRITRLRLPAGDHDLDIELGGPNEQGLRAQDLVAITGRPTSVAAALYAPGTSSTPHVGVTVYDDGERRASPESVATNHIEGSSWSSRIYGFYNETTDYGFHRLRLGSNTVTYDGSSWDLTNGFSNDIVYDQGLMFTYRGDVFDPEDLTVRGTAPTQGVVEPDVALGRSHWFEGTTLRTFHYSAFTQLGTLELPDAEGATDLERFGSDGIVLGGGANLVFVRSDLIGS